MVTRSSLQYKMVDLNQRGMRLKQQIIKVGMHNQYQLEIISYVLYLKTSYGIYE